MMNYLKISTLHIFLIYLCTFVVNCQDTYNYVTFEPCTDPSSSCLYSGNLNVTYDAINSLTYFALDFTSLNLQNTAGIVITVTSLTEESSVSIILEDYAIQDFEPSSDTPADIVASCDYYGLTCDNLNSTGFCSLSQVVYGIMWNNGGNANANVSVNIAIVDDMCAAESTLFSWLFFLFVAPFSFMICSLCLCCFCRARRNRRIARTGYCHIQGNDVESTPVRKTSNECSEKPPKYVQYPGNSSVPVQGQGYTNSIYYQGPPPPYTLAGGNNNAVPYQTYSSYPQMYQYPPYPTAPSRN